MSNLASITPERFLPIFTKELWHNIRRCGFGVSVQGGYSALITVQESILCTIDFLGHINPDKTFQQVWAHEYNRQQDKLLYIYLSTVHDCLNRLTLSRLCVPTGEDTFDLLKELVETYAPSEDGETPYDHDLYDEMFEDEEEQEKHPGSDFDEPYDAQDEDYTKVWPDAAGSTHSRTVPICPAKLALAAGGVTALAAILLRKRR